MACAAVFVLGKSPHAVTLRASLAFKLITAITVVSKGWQSFERMHLDYRTSYSSNADRRLFLLSFPQQYVPNPCKVVHFEDKQHVS